MCGCDLLTNFMIFQSSAAKHVMTKDRIVFCGSSFIQDLSFIVKIAMFNIVSAV